MKYTFFINQEAIARAGLLGKTDISDWMILEYIKSWEDTKLGQRRGNKIWINYQHLMQEMPLLGINSKSNISRRVNNLVNLGLLSMERDLTEHKVFVETTSYYARILYSKDTNDPVALKERPLLKKNDPVALKERPVALKERPVALKEPIHKSVYIHQDTYISNTCNADALARFKKSEPEKPKLENKKSLMDLVMTWYEQQGYEEDIQAHFEYFLGRLAHYSHLPRDLQGHFQTAIREDWAKLRVKSEILPDWATLPPEGADLVKFIDQHGFPKKLHMMRIVETRAELKRLIAQRLVEHRLNQAA